MGAGGVRVFLNETEQVQVQFLYCKDEEGLLERGKKSRRPQRKRFDPDSYAGTDSGGSEHPFPYSGEQTRRKPLIGLFPELLLVTMQFLEPEEAHRLLVEPPCRVFYHEMTSNMLVWRSICASAPWHIPLPHLDGACMCYRANCRIPLCAARALRRKHYLLMNQVNLIRKQFGTREAKVSQLCEIMNAWPIVLGIQIECLKAVVPLLEAERVRKVAQDSALVHQVVAGLRNFENELELQHMALHSLVLLARPIGGREGAVHIGMAPALPALQGPQGGVLTVLKVMDRHINVPTLQAVACWSLVNFALSATCKNLLMERGGVPRVLRAMEYHEDDINVQFRGLFALINLVVPDVPNEQPPEIELIIDRVLFAMSLFMTHTMLINRGCLVLQNLSLNDMNYSCLRRSSAHILLKRSLIKHGTKDFMLKQSARATIIRLYGDEGLPLSDEEADVRDISGSEDGPATKNESLL